MSRGHFPRGQLGLADLARLSSTEDRDLQRFVARSLGLEYVEEPRKLASALKRMPGKVQATPPPPQPAPSSQTGFVPVSEYPRVPFWAAHSFKVVEEPAKPPTPQPPPPPQPEPVTAKVEFLPLANEASILTALRASSSARRAGGDLDTARIVELWGRGRWVETLPRRLKKTWGSSIHVVIDLSRRLGPYREDQVRVREFLRKFYPREGFRAVDLPDDDCDPRFRDLPYRLLPYSPPSPGSLLLVLGDLGALAPPDPRVEAFWENWGRRLHDRGVEPLALVPCRADAVSPSLARFWTVIAWEKPLDPAKPGLSDDESRKAVDDMLTLLSFALSVEPQLIRFARRLLGDGRRDPGLESKIWEHSAFLSRNPCGAAFLPEEARRLRLGLASQDRRHKQALFEWAERFRRGDDASLWDEELVGLEDEVKNGLIPLEKLDQAIARLEAECQKLTEGKGIADESRFAEAWRRWVLGRVVLSPRRQGAEEVLGKLWAVVHRDIPDAVPPDWADKTWLAGPGAASPNEERLVELVQKSGRIIARPFPLWPLNDPSRADNESPIALIRTRQGRIAFERDALNSEVGRIDLNAEGRDSVPLTAVESLRVRSDMEEIVLHSITRPKWASDFGRDKYGLWAEFTVQPHDKKAAPVRQRLRWIPPGRFMMGSLEDEPGRWDWEQLPHEVVMGQGFWMFSTPCTQALWQAVMGENPSWFEGKPDHPVERVSWNDCQRFVRALNARLGDDEFVLPSEAQWEYACRAGTKTRRYSEDLDAIAWYSKNSVGETHPVGLKDANPWGLYDMLGNVWEWCSNAWTDVSTISEGSFGPYRVIRGGSWSYSAEDCAAAFRSRLEPSSTSSYLGLRLARVPSASQVKEQVPGVESSVAGQRGASGPDDGTVGIGIENRRDF